MTIVGDLASQLFEVDPAIQTREGQVDIRVKNSQLLDFEKLPSRVIVFSVSKGLCMERFLIGEIPIPMERDTYHPVRKRSPASPGRSLECCLEWTVIEMDGGPL